MRIFDKLKNHLISPNIKDMIVLILSRGSSFVLSYLNLILITKLLNVDLFGEYKFYLHVLSFTSIFFEFGIFTSGSRLIGQTNSEEEKIKMRPPNVLYEVILTWDGNSEDDLDIYVQAASGHVVSFNNREGGQGSLISLDHDALGKRRNNSLAKGQEGTVVNFNEEVVIFCIL